MVVHLPSASLARAKEMLMPLLYAPNGLAGGSHVGAGTDAGATAPDAATPMLASSSGGQRIYYRVQEGDTLDSLERRFGIAREAIASDNALDLTAGLRP